MQDGLTPPAEADPAHAFFMETTDRIFQSHRRLIDSGRRGSLAAFVFGMRRSSTISLGLAEHHEIQGLASKV